VRERQRVARPMPGMEQDDGMGMVEVIVSMFVLTVAVLAMAQGIALALNSLGTSTQRQQATAEVTAVLEQARSLDHATVAMRTGDAVIPGAQYDPDGAGPLQGEAVLATATGAITGPPYQSQNGPRTVRTYVTQFVDPTLPAGGDNARRVTAVATYGTGQEVRQSTLIAATQRGLPVPAYSVSPETRALSAPASSTVCAGHGITNHGTPDRYDVLLPTAPALPAGYTVAVYHDVDGDGVLDAGEPALTDLSGDGRPDTAAPLDTNATLSLLLCYDGTATTTEPPPVSLSTEVRSLYDSAVTKTLTHELTIGSGLFLLLHDLDNTQAHDRVVADVLPMNPTPSIQTTLFDYDTNLDPADLPGIYLPRGGQTVRWRHQFPAVRTIDDEAMLRVWVAPTTALTGSGPPVDIRLSVEVDHLRSNGNQQADLSTQAYLAPHAGTGWQMYDLLVPLPPTTSFTVNQYLQLTLGCQATSGQDCHVAYDTTGFPSYLRVQSP